MLKYRTLFETIHPFFNLTLQVWIAFMLMNVLVLKDCLSIFRWICLKLEKLGNLIIKTLCTIYFILWASFLSEVQRNFSHPIFWKLTYNEQQSCEDSSCIVKSPRFQAQRNELSVARTNSEPYMCQNCHSMNQRMCFKNLARTLRDNSPVIQLIKRSVGTQTLIQPENLNTEYSHLGTPANTSILSIFGKELDSAESRNNCLKSSNVKKQIAQKCKISPVKYSSVSPERKNDSNSRSLSSEFEKNELSSENQNVSRTTPENVSEEFVDIPLESPTNLSQLLESPLCQINLDSMKNLRLTFSEDICIPRLSPPKKSIFKKSWNKLKLVRKVNKSFLEMKNMKRRNPGGISPISRQPFAGVECSDIPRQKDIKNLTAEVEDSEIVGCCSYMFHSLKSKFDQKGDEGSVVYKKF